MDVQTPVIPRLDLIRVEEVMHAGLIGCDPAAPLPVIARIFAEEQIHAVVVGGIDRTREGERLTWGIISDHDLMRALDATGESVTAAALAVTAMITAPPKKAVV